MSEKLTTEEFKKKVFDYETNKEWKFEGELPCIIDFYADWCVSCKEMENFTFTDANVQARLKDVLLLQADVTANSADDKALLARFKLFGPPGIVFFDKSGNEIAYRVVGYEPAEKFLASLNKALP